MSRHEQNEFAWAVPVMRMGYAGRGLTYLVIAGVSLWAILRGGEAQGTESALATLQAEPGGAIVLIAIAFGLIAYMVWRVIDALWDLEAYEWDAKGLVARGGMIVTGLIHGALGVGAIALIFGSGGSGEGSRIAEYAAQVLSWPYGRWILGVAGLLTMGAGIYYLHKGWSEKYREALRGNKATMRWNWVLKSGLVAQGIIVFLIGLFLGLAGLRGNAQEAGGLNQVFEFLRAQAFGNAIVVAICLGLLGFALFCFVNARYRIVPRVAGDDVETLAARFKAAKEEGKRKVGA